MKSTFLVRLSACAFALVLAGCGREAQHEPKMPQPVAVYTVTMEDSAPILSFPAVAAAADKSVLSFRLPGEIIKVNVKPGEFVKEGQLLAQLDPTDYQLEVNDAQAKFNVADSQYRRSAKLVKQGYLAQSQFDELAAQRQIAKARLNLAKLRLTFTELHAPFSGVISRVPVEQFENVQVGEAVMNIHSAKNVDILIQAPDMIYSKSTARQVQDRHPGTKVVLDTGHEYTAYLKEYTTEPDPELGSFKVTLTMPMPKDEFILDGTAVEVKVDAQRVQVYRSDEVVIPLEAVFNEDGDDIGPANKFVWVVNEDHTVTKRQVVTDKVVPNGVRLVSGLKEGEVIVTEGVNRLRDGQQVNIVDQEAASS
ncbi:efflux RND transporter periplasmic adaptor subunit [Photobacterium sp. CCB-ST2H9]|uniref:efflux RND transporter periplasmic adaptor subunit n=1 Tax=unclassified Photobacterium TaxID=2628852 RepID=UPI0020067E55|nr:efflux RND transporter periplasmic adaptor subunit [Photobacterium sp. CCB-ST2H9]UTM56230.1 efflux RND transporter periplasmic adaptor subunit [Photobacterium sp. CCB-ST2H9]